MKASWLLAVSTASLVSATTANVDRTPLYFEPNLGQAAESVRFVGRTGNSQFLLNNREAVVVVHGPSNRPRTLRELGDPDRRPDPPAPGPAVLRMRFLDANPNAAISGLEPLPGSSNYFRRAVNVSNVPHFGRVRYEQIYPGVDLVFYGNPHQLQYDFIVAAGADPNRIRFSLEGPNHLDLNASGDLILSHRHGQTMMRKPTIYQEAEGERRLIAGEFQRTGNEIAFHVDEYDTSLPLVIDPVVDGTFLGGAAVDLAIGVATDSNGNVYVTGATNSAADFPLVDPPQSEFAGQVDAFVVKLDPSMSNVIYSTFFGGSNVDQGIRIAVDDGGRASVVGTTSSSDLPFTSAGFQPIFGGGDSDVFLLQLNPAGDTIEGATFAGDIGNEVPFVLVFDAESNPIVAGWTTSETFPTTPGAVQDRGNGGSDAFLLSTSPSGDALLASTLLGGTSNEIARGLAIDHDGNLLLSGDTLSPDFPLAGTPLQEQLAGNSDVFLSRVSPDATSLGFSTFLGGSGKEEVWGLQRSPAGQLAIAGFSDSPNFPSVPDFPVTPRGQSDPFLIVLDLPPPPAPPVLNWTFLGGGPGPDILSAFNSTFAPGGSFLTFSLFSTSDSLEQSTLPDIFDDCLGPRSNRIEQVSFGGGVHGHGCLGQGSINGSASGRGGIDLLALNADGDLPPVPPDAFDPTFNGGIDGVVLSFPDGRGNLLPFGGAITVEQITYDFGEVKKENSSTAILTIDIERLAEETDQDLGYFNLTTDRGWVGPNLSINRFDTSLTLSYNIELLDPDVVDNNDPEPGPRVVFLYAGPSFDAKAQLAPPPVPDFIRIPVVPTKLNFGGVGPTPTAVPEVTKPELNFNKDADNFAYMLPNNINIQAAQDQCFPMSIANSLAWLDAQYPGVNVPHEHKPGLKGDNTLVGKLDTAMNRAVKSRTDADGVFFEGAMTGKFKYMSENGLKDSIITQHMGKGNEPGFPDGDFESSGIKSEHKGDHVTFDWICSEIQKGEDIELVYTWEAAPGGSAGAHAVRVVGCGKTRGTAWLKLLDDGLQSRTDRSDRFGLRVRQVFVADLDDDGDLNFDSFRKEINYAIAESPKPEVKDTPGSPAFSLQDAITNGASFATTIAPGGISAAFGLYRLLTGDDSSQNAPVPRAANTGLPTEISGLEVHINGEPVPLYAAFPSQVNFQLPFDLPPGEASLVFIQNGRRGASILIPIEETAPGIFPLNEAVAGPGRGVVQNQDFSLNTPDNPASPGQAVVVYTTGLGAVDNPVPAGQSTPSSPLSQTIAEVAATVGGQVAQVAFAGLTPGFVGLYQVNLVVPQLDPGDHEIIITAGANASNGALMAVGQ